MTPALLLVDLQRDYLAAPGLQPPADSVIRKAAVLLKSYRERGLPVIHIRTTINPGDDRRLPHWKREGRMICVAGTPGHEPPADLRPRDGEPVIHKTGFNPFASGELEKAIARAGCDAVVLAGVHLHACVRTAAVECLERGLRVFIAADATGSNDPVHAAAAQRWMAARCIDFAPVGSLVLQENESARRALIHYSPCDTGRALFEVPETPPHEIAAAVENAGDAWKKWREASLSTRLQLVEKVIAGLETATPDLAHRMAVEIGKPITHAFEEMGRTIHNLRDVARRAAAFELQVAEPAGLVRHRPLGVVAVISPWNNPVAIPLGKIAPALAFGNTMVWKSAPPATAISRAIFEVLCEAGMPDGVVQLITGANAVAQQLAENAGIHAVSFTGSLHGGRAMQEICARRMVPLQAELNGNNAAIVWDPADAADAALQIARGAFGFAGQRCTANRRVIVPESLKEQFFDALAAASKQMTWGDPLEKATDIGPALTAEKRAEHNELIAAAEKQGLRIELPFQGRSMEPWATAGAFAQPAIVACDDPRHPLVQEETMSPLLVIQGAADFEQALALCNGVRFGLSAAIFTRDAGLQKRFLAGAEAGILRINASTAGADASLPFGGWKASGAGPPEHGIGDRLFYTHIQTVYGAGGN